VAHQFKAITLSNINHFATSSTAARTVIFPIKATYYFHHTLLNILGKQLCVAGALIFMSMSGCCSGGHIATRQWPGYRKTLGVGLLLLLASD